ncbi:hypothetical protein RirG_106500 [Rhizophagus irregularis DAOM 197198w]|uniref:Retrotransposon gag domain-containing protein n=1 Tax=Rhizophagus irregularis (strain DAOM 197198w) TaxID=1432141 RepID=A0A015JFL2_RHIIW|nr:hypothetical protein RirG_106500 [Rhizophagus irregularis DAOM 197198w]
MLELRKTKQGINESVEDYTRRFRQVLRVATRGHALADEYQVDFYIEGLEATVGREEEARNELFRKVGNIPDRVYPEIGKERIEERNVGMNVRYNKPLNENYEDELVEKLEKMRIAKLEKQVRNMERELNNNGNKDQLNQRRNNRAPINYDEITCFRCHRRDYEHESEESDDDYDYEYGEYDNSQLYSYDRDLYEKDNPVRRRSNRLNPVQGWKVFGKLDLDKDIVERGKKNINIGIEEKFQWKNMWEMSNQCMMDRYKWSKKRGEYYDTMEGINRWKEAGGKRGPREDNIVGVRSKDPVDYGNLLNIVEQQGRMIKRMLRKG